MDARAGKAERLQRHRRAMTLLSVVNYALQALVLALYATTGSVSWAIVEAFLAVSIAASFAFWLTIRLGWNLRLADPGMLGLQLAVGCLVQLGFLLAAPQLAVLFLATLLVGFAHALIAFDARRLAIAWLLSGAASALALWMVHERFAWPGSSPADIAVLWFFFFLCMFRLTAIGTQVSKLRGKLSQRNLQLRESLAKIERLASHDDLTGVMNRRAFFSGLAAERSRSQRSNSPFCIVLFDIDYFKRINDTHGHASGDSVLRHFCTVVGAELRTADSFARYGGEEFILLLPAAIDIEGGHLVAERIRRHVAAYDWGRVIPGMAVTVSGGVACFRRDEPLEQLIARADHALYEAKAAGRDRIVAAA